jgi:hypothetical protein
VAGVAVIGAVAAIVALAVALRVAHEEELALEAAAETLERRLDVRLARIEAQLAGWTRACKRRRWSQSMTLFAADKTMSSERLDRVHLFDLAVGINRWI